MLNTLNVGQSGLNAAKIAVENVSNNIANENTPGYKKRVVDLKEIEQADSRFTGRGVSATDAYRITDQYSYNNLITEGSKSNYYDEISTILSTVEASFSETDTSGFSSNLNRYFQSIENLRANPNSEIYKADLSNQGTILVDSLQNLYTSIENEEELLSNSLNDDVEIVNNLLHDIGEVNEQLGKYAAASNDLLDRRDQLEQELAQYVDIKVDRTDDEYELEIGGFVAIRYNTNVREISFEKEDTTQVDKFLKEDGTGSNILDTITTFDNEDEITYKLNNEFSVTVRNGESMNFDLDGDGTSEAVTVDASNYVRALAHKINTNTDTKDLVTAYNGAYQIDSSGNKNDASTVDKYLLIESNETGVKGSFEGRIAVVEQTDYTDETTITNRESIYKDDYQSSEATSKEFMSIYSQEVTLKAGSIKAKVENLSSEAGLNKFDGYKEKLDNFAKTLSDITDKYVKLDDDENYLYGEKASDEYDGSKSVNSIGLFSGTDVKSLAFDKSVVSDLELDALNYLSTLQWKDDISFTSTAQNPDDKEVTSFSAFFQELRVNISSDKESNDFLLDTQESVVQSLQSNYDNLVKVDSDEEMLNLIKFQAAYSANAKIITTIDEMLQVLLGIKS